MARTLIEDLTDSSIEFELPDTTPDQQLLTLARRLDRFGGKLERFLSVQLQQLELAISNFERERSAWEEQRDAELAKLMQASGGHRSNGPTGDGPGAGNVPAEPAIASQPGPAATAPLKIVVQPGAANEEWLAAWMLEISKLNWAFGGEGVRFEVAGCRVAKSAMDPGDELLELEVFSRVPLIQRVNMGETLRQVSDRIDDWMRFKSSLMMTSLVDNSLAGMHRHANAVSDHDGLVMLRAAAYQEEQANARMRTREKEERVQPREQLLRVEATTKVLIDECETRIHVSLL
ncbi:MAG: hypothetical protein KDA58_00960 [Planctomycetaceae bacterium]|nr:hypothetical protein [Planctomycetaceae bacterium]